MTRKKLVVGNWKMNGSLAANHALLQTLLADPGLPSTAVDVAVCAPFPYLAQISELLTGSAWSWGAQNVSEHTEGAYTGEVSAAMLAEFACRYVIVGHSERRSLYGESDAICVDKFVAARRVGLTPIFCVGETLAEREAGATFSVVLRQLSVLLERCGVGALVDSVLAYEPLWAIGTGRTATPAQAQEVHAALRARVGASDVAVAAGLAIIYGGSVKAANAADMFAQADIDGGLVGGAALLADEFSAICRAAAVIGKQG
jgi:triosephosphate isomerase (TIM)